MSQETPTPQTQPPEKNGLQIVQEELLKQVTGRAPAPVSRWQRIWQVVAIPFLAIITGLLLGGLFIVFTSPEFYTAWGQSPIEGLKAGWNILVQSYSSLFIGAFGDPQKIAAAMQSGEPEALRKAFYPFFESLVAATPYIFGGLAVALAFQAGLFNIGVEGQIFMGAIFSAYVGYAFTGLPVGVHMMLAFFAGAIGGGLWGLIPGWLKARTGGHEVINTIMLNYIAFRISDWLLTGPMKRPGSPNPVSPTIQDSAKLFRFFGDPIRFHFGFFLALLIAWLAWWFLYKTRWGFDMRAVGLNPHAARYAGMIVSLTTIAAMTISGALGGLAGANEVLGVNYNLAMAFSSGYGFDSIALALLGKSHPLGVVLAALLFGTLRNGATNMQLKVGIPVDIISILQAFILVFIAAPAIIRSLYRLKKAYGAGETISLGSWGGK